MGEPQDLADHVVVVGRGRVLADARADGLLAGVSGDEVLVRAPAPAEAARVLQQAGSTSTGRDGDAMTVSGLGARRVVEILNQTQVALFEAAVRRATLEEVYLQLIINEAEYRAALSEVRR
jgi:ABC-2 type transport system ATP-binding protein